MKIHTTNHPYYHSLVPLTKRTGNYIILQQKYLIIREIYDKLMGFKLMRD